MNIKQKAICAKKKNNKIEKQNAVSHQWDRSGGFYSTFG